MIANYKLSKSSKSSQRKLPNKLPGELLTHEEENILGYAIREGKHKITGKPTKIGRLARNILAECNEGLVKKTLGSFHLKGDQGDYLSEGYFALRNAIEGYNPDKGFRFSTYAVWAIKNAYRRVLRNKKRRSKEMNFSEYSNEDEDYAPPDPEELQNQTETIEEKETKLYLNRALNKLSNRERHILKLRYKGEKGVNGEGHQGKEMSLSQIGNRVGLTKERIRQIEKEALKKLSKNPELELIV